MAIAKFVARKAGMAGETDLEFARADMVACHSEDLWKFWPKLRFEKDQVGRVSLCIAMYRFHIVFKLRVHFAE